MSTDITVDPHYHRQWHSDLCKFVDEIIVVTYRSVAMKKKSGDLIIEGYN